MFIVALIVLLLICARIGAVVRDSVLGGLDRTLGLVFGLARGAALVIIAYIIGWDGGAGGPLAGAGAARPARCRSPIEGANWVVAQLPPDYRPRLYAPPAGRETTAAACCTRTPQGRATGRPPERE